jgi:uncharacterized protein YcnI
MSSGRKLLTRAAVTLTASGVLVLAAAGVAAAHVTAHTPDALTQGGTGEIVFRVPDEEATAHTTKVEVTFSTIKPVPDASIKPVPGWTATITNTKLPTPVRTGKEILTTGVKSITWTAPAGQGIAPGQFQEFTIDVEGLPETADMVMPTVQTYDNGDVVNWNQLLVAGKPEPDHPAPHLTLATSADSAVAPAAAATTPRAAAPIASTSDSTARWLGGIGIVIAAIAFGFGAGAFFRRRNSGAAV